MGNISRKITTLYKKRLMTLEELAEKIGFSYNGLHKALKANDFKISVLEKIADVLKVELSYFFGDDNKTSIENNDSLGMLAKKYANELQMLETILKNRDVAIYQYHSLGKAFHTIIDDLLDSKIDLKDINTHRFEALKERFFGIDVSKLYRMDIGLDYDYKEWLKEIISNKKEYSTKEYYKKKNFDNETESGTKRIL